MIRIALKYERMFLRVLGLNDQNDDSLCCRCLLTNLAYHELELGSRFLNVMQHHMQYVRENLEHHRLVRFVVLKEPLHRLLYRFQCECRQVCLEKDRELTSHPVKDKIRPN